MWRISGAVGLPRIEVAGVNDLFASLAKAVDLEIDGASLSPAQRVVAPFGAKRTAMPVVQVHRDDPKARPSLAIGELCVRGAATHRFAVGAANRHVHAARGVVIAGTSLFRAIAQELELPGVVEDAGALCPVVGAWLDVRGRTDELVTTIANHIPQRALQAGCLAQMPRCGS